MRQHVDQFARARVFLYNPSYIVFETSAIMAYLITIFFC